MLLRNCITYITGGGGNNRFRMNAFYHKDTQSLVPVLLGNNDYAQECYLNSSTFARFYWDEGWALDAPVNTFYDNLAYASNYDYLVVLPGTGTTPPTVEDRLIEAIIPASSLSCTSSTFSFTNNNLSVSTTYQNVTEANITVTETCLGIANRHYANTSSYTVCGAGILTRSIMLPVTIGPNEKRTFTIVIDFNKMLETTTNS